MAETKACLLSYAISPEGMATNVDLSALPEDGKSFVWVHLHGRNPETKKILKDQFNLDPLLVRTLLDEDPRPRMEDLQSSCLLVLRGINFYPGPKPEDLVSVRMIISENRVISISRRKSRAVAEIEERLKIHTPPRTPGEFLGLLCSGLNDGIEGVLEEIEKDIDLLDETAPENLTPEMRHRMPHMRRQIMLFRRHLWPQRDVISRLQRLDYPWISPTDKWVVHENQERTARLIEDIDMLRERVQILQDGMNSALSGRLNKNLYILSLITAIFMPLTFLSGLLGMNVHGIPMAESPYAFAVVCGIALFLGLVQILIFRRLKWL
jgi:zinc transporter